MHDLMSSIAKSSNLTVGKLKAVTQAIGKLKPKLEMSDEVDMEGAQAELTPQQNETYQQLLDNHVAPEVARAVLPQSMYTEFIETASLYAYARLCKLRLDPHAQKEIRDYANAVSNLLEKRFPISWKALMN
jgi:thymidylate synthase (FAD)